MEKDIINRFGYIKKILTQDSVLLSIGNVADAIGSTPRKLRYWEKKGYISPVKTSQGRRKYSYFMMVRACIIQYLIDEGFTLKIAVKKTDNHEHFVKEVHNLLYESFKDMNETDHGIELNLGKVSGTDNKILYLDIDDNGSRNFSIR